MQKYIDMMGHNFRDLVTGFEGCAESVSFDLYGCVQVALKPKVKKDGTFPDGRWFDATRLKQISTKRLMDVPTFVRLEPGPQSKKVLEPAPGPAEKPTLRG